MCEFINNQKLFSNLEYRFQYLTKFIGFNSKDIQLIHTHAAPVLAPLLPTVVDLMFTKIEKFSTTATQNEVKSSLEIAVREQASLDLKEHVKLLMDLSGGDLSSIGATTTPPPNDRSEEEVLSLLKRETLGRYLEKLVTAQIDDIKFVRYLDWIGKLHSKQYYENGKPMNKMRVDYIHLNNFFGYLSDIIIQAIFDSKLKGSKRDNTLKALNKLMWVHNDFFTKYQVDDLDRNVSTCPISGATGKSCPVQH